MTSESGAASPRGSIALLDSAGVGARRFVVSSPTVWRVHGARIGGGLSPEDEPILIPDGERFKNLQTVGRIYDALLRAEADRGTVLVAVGGGVVGDTAGFAAATYMRGIALVHVPTTLLAQVDSSIGGKVGVNHAQGKNLIGAFHQPALVAVDPSLLDTLPRREFRAGLYEVVKYGMIAERRVVRSRLARLDRALRACADALEPVIAACCRIKAAVVESDEREDRPTPSAELRPHHGARPGSGDEVPSVPARRGGRLRHARRVGSGGGPRHHADRGPRRR